jgi:hypothetical protein
MTGDPFPHRSHLRLVPRRPWPRRLEVRISDADGRVPVGRTKIFRLDPHDFEQLMDAALRLEARR